ARSSAGGDALNRHGGEAPPMAEIVPRWEWRAFGEDFGEAESHFGALEPERVQESDELYLLSRNSDENVKIRDDLLDVKTLEHVNDEGLEQWIPVLKAEFPVPADELGPVLERLRVDAGELARDAYTLDQLLEEVVRPNADLMAVK